MSGYQRQSAADIVPTAVVRAAPINNEFNALRDTFLLAGGHRHDGSSTEGAHVPLIADADALNKVAIDTTNNRVGVFVEVGGAAVEQVRVQDGAVVPVTTADIDLGTSALKFKSAFLSGTAAVDILTAATSASIPSLTVGTNAVIASADINAGTVDGTVIGASSAQAVTGTLITATTGFVGGLTGAVTGNTAGTHTGPVIGAVTGNVTGNVTASTGTSSFNDVTINGGLNMNAGTAATITNLTSPTNTGDAATKGYVDTADALKLNLSGGTMSGAIAMGTNKITGVGTPTLTADAATKGYVDTSISNLIDASPGTLDTLNELAAALGDDPNFATTVTNSIATKLPLAGGTMTGAIAMGTNKITGLGNPTLAQDAATKTYVDTADALKLNLSGGTMSGAIAMGTNKITGLGTPSATTDAATKGYVDTADALKLSLTGGTMSGAIAMGTSKITGLGTPTADADATTKLYVDGILGSATSAATSAAAAAVSASNAATSASNASTSETNAAASATSAAASYDSFDDRYLGSKTTNPTLDNDGNALLTGALYFNSTASEMRVYSGTAWQAASTVGGTVNTLTVTGAATFNSTVSASLATGYEAAALNLPSIKPSLLLDFAATKALDPRITFTRASTATYYDGKTTAKAEENLFVYSQDLDVVANWLLLAASVTANSIAAPDGTTTAETLTADGTSNLHAAKQNTSASTVGKTVSIYAKSGTNQFLQILFDADAAPFANFDLTAGTVGTVGSGVTASIVSVGNSWYRCVCTTTSTTATNAYFAQSNSSSAARYPTFVGSGTIYLWGAQSENRTAVTAYTATTTQAITNYVPVLLTAASGAARFDNSPTTSESLGLLIEESRTNLLLRSAEFDNSSWVKNGTSTVEANVRVVPDSTISADKISQTTNASVRQDITAVGNLTYTGSLYVHTSSTSTLATLNGFFLNTTENVGGVTFNPSTGAFISSTNNALYTITSVGNGWFRISYVFVGTNVANTFLRLQIFNDSANSNLVLWGAQLEAGAFATSYIPTVASQVTRAADVAAMTGTNFSSWYRQDLGTIYVDFVGAPLPLSGSSPVWSAATAGGATIGDNESGNNVRTSLSSVAYTDSSGVTTVVGLPYKIAYRVQGGNYASSVNGGTIQASSLATNPTTQTLVYFGSSLTGQNLNSTIKKIAYYPKALTNAELQGVTS